MYFLFFCARQTEQKKFILLWLAVVEALMRSFFMSLLWNCIKRIIYTPGNYVLAPEYVQTAVFLHLHSLFADLLNRIRICYVHVHVALVIWVSILAHPKSQKHGVKCSSLHPRFYSVWWTNNVSLHILCTHRRLASSIFVEIT